MDRVWVRVGVRSGLGRGGRRTVEEGGVHGEAGVREETPPLEEGRHAHRVDAVAHLGRVRQVPTSFRLGLGSCPPGQGQAVDHLY